MSRVHVIGAGLAGLSTAVQLADRGFSVRLYEQARHAGGRARSFHDKHLDRLIDNGNHLLLSGNYSALEYLDIIHARQRLSGPSEARFDFADLQTGDEWSINFNRGPVPLWVLYESKRVPGTSMMDYVAGLKLLTAGNRSIASLFASQGQMYRRFWEPFAVAVLNTDPEEAVARLLLPVIRETLAKGSEFSKPLVAKKGLSNTFVDPALAWMKHRKVEMFFNTRIAGLNISHDRVTGIKTGKENIALEAGDKVVLATPPWVSASLWPQLQAPNEFAPIVNVHFRLDENITHNIKKPLLGLVGSLAQWVFVRDDIISVTVSAAYQLAEKSPEQIARLIWPEVARAYGLQATPLPPVRVIKEQRATFKVTASQLDARPEAQTALKNLVLAGDWTDTGLPATIEGAIRSGVVASRIVMS